MRPRRERRGRTNVDLGYRGESASGRALQCGHGANAVENGVSCGFSRLVHCFNAATARKPWRTTIGVDEGRRGPSLQCGHGANAVNNAAVNTGPRRWTRKSFNAATTRRPWRTNPNASATPADAPRELQCGHDPKAVENDGPARPSADSEGGLRMRPRPEGRGEPPDARAVGPENEIPELRMRPRPEGRGELGRPLRRTSAARGELQCGHDPKAVENSLLGIWTMTDD